uniref:Putative ABC transport system permease protein n=1 Tax=Candidatus Kentrum sp. FW TaxID=2126338 RepID=A0A450SP53_9GAMM|nr:MAG: putative ABC transport system permease protein [Candidatus Kentron sp. FW]VFJ55684.1 MAG: putative ABC transport system permease protein [Candidatus Kentron sp. FW]
MFGIGVHIGPKMLMHRKGHLLLLVSAIGFSVLIMFLQIGFFHGINDSQAHIAGLLNADMVVLDWRRTHLNNWWRMGRIRLAQLRAIAGVAEVVPLYKGIMDLENPNTKQLRRIGAYAFPPESAPFHLPDFAEKAQRLKVPGTVLFDLRSRDIYGPVATRETLILNGNRFSVAGYVSIGPNLINDGIVLLGEGSWLAHTRGLRPIMALVRLEKSVSSSKVKQRIMQRLPDVAVFTPEELYDREVAYTTKVAPMGTIFGAGLIIGLIIGLVICYQILFNEITDHIPQYAVLMAMGYSRGFLVRVILEEAFLLSVFGFVPGLLSAAAVYRVIRDMTGLRMLLTPEQTSFIFLLTVIMCLVAGLLALRRVLRIDPAQLY